MQELSIIIPTLNEQDYIGLLLGSIARQNFQGEFEVIIVDGDSTDATENVVHSFEEHIHSLTFISIQPDIGRQRNLGVNKARYETLLFLDADVILPDGFLDVLAVKSYPSRLFIAATLHLGPAMSFFDYIALGIVYGLFMLAWLLQTPVTNGDFILTTASLHRLIGGFREGAIIGEDTDYGIRAVKAGAKYRFFFRTFILASDRRLHQVGRLKLIKIWSKAFLHARRSGPTYSGVTYPFGVHDPIKASHHHLDRRG
jgi:glycosyltransferase involved in cell wall biosynthesis